MIVHEQQRRFARSKFPQANYKTATDAADPENFVEFLVSDKNLATLSTNSEDNREDSTGYEQPTEEYITDHDTARQAERAVCFEEVGRDLLLALGSVTTTQPNAGAAPTVYKHVFKRMDMSAAGRQLLAMTLIEIVGDAINRLLPSMLVESLDFKGEGTKRIRESMALRGSGKVVTPSGLTVDDIEPLTGLHYALNSQVKLTLADAGTLANSSDFGAGGKLDSWSFGIKNALLADEGFRPGAGLYQTANDPASGAIRSECLVGLTTFMMDYQARLLAQSEQLAALRAKKQLDGKVEMIGSLISGAYNHKLTIHAPRLSYETVETPTSNGLYRVGIKSKIFYDLTSNKDVEIELINTVPSYTA